MAGTEDLEAAFQYVSDIHKGELGSVVLTGGAVALIALTKLDLTTAKRLRAFLISQPSDTTSIAGAYNRLMELCLAAILDRQIVLLTRAVMSAEEN